MVISLPFHIVVDNLGWMKVLPGVLVVSSGKMHSQSHKNPIADYCCFTEDDKYTI